MAASWRAKDVRPTKRQADPPVAVERRRLQAKFGYNQNVSDCKSGGQLTHPLDAFSKYTQRRRLLFQVGDVISYLEMCSAEGVNLQRGMNFRLGKTYSVILMSVRPNAPYADRIEENGRVLIYEGHDVPRRKNGPDPKSVDQPMLNPGGSLTQNGLFYQAAKRYIEDDEPPEPVKVYEKIRSGIWTYNGFFLLIDAWIEQSNGRKVFKFKLEISEDQSRLEIATNAISLNHNRLIPAEVKRAVWKRDKGRCVICGSTKNLHFDHIIPYSKGGSSLVADNIQLLCAKHNLEKRDKIE